MSIYYYLVADYKKIPFLYQISSQLEYNLRNLEHFKKNICYNFATFMFRDIVG